MDNFLTILNPILLMMGCIVILMKKNVGCFFKALAALITISIPVYDLSSRHCTSSANLLCFPYSFLTSLSDSLSGLVDIAVTFLVLGNVILAFINIIGGLRNRRNSQIISGAICGLIALSTAPAVSDPSLVNLGLDVMGMIFGIDGIIGNSLRNFD